jgi:hypothetical protein
MTTETTAEVFAALVEDYRQAAQDAIHARWGESWPTHAAQEAAELEALHARCAGWLARFETATEGAEERYTLTALGRAALATALGRR